ncbi:DUF2800 domain-containing protein [Azospirillum argentinense]|uniref:DUF2800 domain-containing protein n=1 Tax=Azospirillum brasilense TaxID=192 RepID=A0A4D8Q852_AZOBR|nr:DUF2800 domain-containing protein [Azospirillum argentinense]QCO05463.1 DUF2800 domain-containing protein [Azospirillum argentinense]
MAEHAVRPHASLGASGAYRWMACPGSIRMSDGVPERTSDYAKEGTAAHELAQACLEQNRDPIEFVDRSFNGVMVTDLMAAAVETYIKHARSMIEPGDLVLVEHRFSLEALTKGTAVEGVPMFGTADLVVYKRELRWLYVLDYKHGAGVPVEAKGNPQGRYYALGAALSLQDQGVNPVRVHIEIIQPRVAHFGDPPIRTESLDPMELIEWSADLLEAAERTLAADAPLSPGGHCRFCPAAAICPALQQHALVEAQAEFSPAGAVTIPPEPTRLTPEQVGRVLDAADTIEKWLGAVRAHAQGELEAGRAIPGWKLVGGKQGNREWSSETDAALELVGAGLSDDAIYEKKLISPTQAEKLIGKKAMADLSDLVTRKPGRPTLAPAGDKRPAITGGASADFTAIPA